MSSYEKIKIAIIAVFTGVTSYLGVVAIPFYILVGVNMIDYTTGLVAAKYRNEKIDSDKGFRGIVKKVCMWLLVVIGAVLDFILINFGKTIGATIPLQNIIALAVVLWLIFNEIISILENMGDIGTPLPPFLLEIVKNLKNKTEKTVETERRIK